MPNEGKEPGMPYETPPLPYDYAALEPHIDEATMRLHHDKHHQTYVDKVNAALEGTDHAVVQRPEGHGRGIGHQAPVAARHEGRERVHGVAQLVRTLEPVHLAAQGPALVQVAGFQTAHLHLGDGIALRLPAGHRHRLLDVE